MVSRGIARHVRRANCVSRRFARLQLAKTAFLTRHVRPVAALQLLSFPREFHVRDDDAATWTSWTARGRSSGIAMKFLFDDFRRADPRFLCQKPIYLAKSLGHRRALAALLDVAHEWRGENLRPSGQSIDRLKNRIKGCARRVFLFSMLICTLDGVISEARSRVPRI